MLRICRSARGARKRREEDERDERVEEEEEDENEEDEEMMVGGGGERRFKGKGREMRNHSSRARSRARSGVRNIPREVKLPRISSPPRPASLPSCQHPPFTAYSSFSRAAVERERRPPLRLRRDANNW